MNIATTKLGNINEKKPNSVDISSDKLVKSYTRKPQKRNESGI